MSFDFNYFKKYKKYYPLLLLLVPLFLSIFFRYTAISMPMTGDWAKETVLNNIYSNIAKDISSKYPLLPDANVKPAIEKEYNSFVQSNQDLINNEIRSLDEYFSSFYRDNQGVPYLTDIDSWLWYGHARNYINHGMPGDEIVYTDYYTKGVSSWSQRNGRFGQITTDFKIYPWMIMINYKVMNAFKQTNLMEATAFMPVILSALAVIFAFFAAKKLGGNLCGFIFASLIAVHDALLSRTISADNDSFILLFSVMMIWAFIYVFEAEGLKKTWIWIFVLSLVTAVFSLGHRGYYHIFDIILFTTFCYFVYCFVRKKFVEAKRLVCIGLGYPVLFILFSSCLQVFLKDTQFIQTVFEVFRIAFFDAFTFITLKDVATTTIMPNVMTTVAELMGNGFGNFINLVGGGILFTIAITGIVIFGIKRSRKFFYGVFFGTLFLASIYASISSIRLLAMFIPPFVFLIAYFASESRKVVVERLPHALNIHPLIIDVIITFLLIFVLVLPFVSKAMWVSERQIPFVNDEWVNGMNAIKQNSSDAIITSWWDFGHIFTALSERRVTFDGGDQGERIYWVGRALASTDEYDSMAVLRMLDCGQEEALHTLSDSFGGDVLRALDVLNKALYVNDKVLARGIFESEGLNELQVAKALNYTYCDDLIDNYFLLSDDMVGKAPVWSHFGLWNFTKADMYNKGLAPYGVVADNWISPWYGVEDLNGSLFNRMFFTNETFDCFDLFYESKFNPVSLKFKIFKVDFNCTRS